MRPVGFSTGALAYADFRRGVAMSLTQDCQALELSALRQPELVPMLDAISDLDLGAFPYVSIHAPSQFEAEREGVVWERLYNELHRAWPVVVHPDALSDLSLWREFGPLLCI